MINTSLTSREFNQNIERAKKAAENGPVFIADRGRSTHVLLSIEDCRRQAGKKQRISDLLVMPAADDVETGHSYVTRPATTSRAVLMYLLVTNLVCALRNMRGENAKPKVVRCAVNAEAASLFVSAITSIAAIGLLHGVTLLRETRKPLSRRALRSSILGRRVDAKRHSPVHYKSNGGFQRYSGFG